MTIQDKLIRHQTLLQRLAQNQYQTLETSLSKAIKLAAKRAANLKNQTVRESKIVAGEIDVIFADMLDKISASSKSYAVYESQFISKVIKGVTPDSAKVVKALESRTMGVGLAANRQGKSLDAALSLFANRKRNEIIDTARQLSVLGMEQVQIEYELYLLLGGRLRTQAQSLANTIVNHSMSIGKEVTYEANKDLIDYLVWMSVLDSHTTDYCREHNELTYPVGVGPRPPAHWRCRSYMSPVLKNV